MLMKAGIKKVLSQVMMHLSAALAAILVADVLFCSHARVSYIDEDKNYDLSILNGSENEVEKSINEIFISQSADIVRYVAACRLLDAFDGLYIYKNVDVSDYYTGDDPVSFEVSISDLINLGSVESNETLTGGEYSFMISSLWNSSIDHDKYLIVEKEIRNASVLFLLAYDIYISGNSLYGSENNIVYLIETKETSGEIFNYSNNADLLDLSDDKLNDYFAGHDRYLICNDNLLETSVSDEVSESPVRDALRYYSDIVSGETSVWMCVDTSSSYGHGIIYDISNYTAEIVRVARFITFGAAAFILLWIIFLISLFRSVFNEKKDKEDILKIQDKIYLEILLLLSAAYVFFMKIYFDHLLNIVERDFRTVTSFREGFLRNAGPIDYLIFAGFGLAVSVGFSFFAFTVSRRIRAGVIFEYSFAKKIKELFEWFALSFSGGSRATATVLIPYILFLLVNLAGQTFSVYFFKSYKPVSVIIVIVIIAIDVYTGISLFLNTAEKKILLDGIARIRNGETDHKIDVQNLRAENRNLAESINNIGEGINTAVKSSMMEEQLRTELITNVSHDLKTPLTSIINYSDLLNNHELNEEQKKEYLTVIHEKSGRLKRLLEDLLEASKLSSGKLELNRERTDLTELLNQALGEYEDIFKEKDLELICDEFAKLYIVADGGSIWRIFNNLFENISKYALKGTRVYVSLLSEDGKAVFKLKNVSAVKPRFQGKELTESFIRGDESRNTEGTGLGLYIAKNLTEANDGRFEIIVDGDMFTSVIEFALSNEKNFSD